MPVHWVARWFGLGVLLGSMTAAAQPKPSVTGPSDGQPTREVTLPGPTSMPLRAAIALDFEGACLEHERLVASVERWLEVDRIHKRVTVSVTGEEAPELAARFWLLVDGQRVSLRRFEAFTGSCSELGASLSAAIALAIEAIDLADFPEPEPPPRPVLPAAKLTARAALQVDEPPLPPPRRRAGALQSLAIGPQILGAAGVAPAAGVGGGVRGELGFLHGVATRLAANYLVLETQPISDGTLAMRLPAGQVGVCWGRETNDYRAQGCLDAWAGALIGTPSQLERQSQQVLPWVAVAPGVELAFRRGKHWGVRLGTQLSFNVMRPRFEVLYNARDETLDEVATPPLGMIVLVGLDWNAI
ncbi:MAG TPA: hypothetical protein VI197_19265 [Polyangiaceae bacterium]